MDDDRLTILSPGVDGELRTWVLGWRGTITRDVGTEYVRAVSLDEAISEYEREHPTRRITNAYESLVD